MQQRRFQDMAIAKGKMRRLRSSLAALIVLAFAGCGTMVNLHHPSNGLTYMDSESCSVLGGVTLSGGMARLGLQGELGADMHGLPFVLMAAVDTPLSLVGDILTLPVVCARAKGHLETSKHNKQLKGETTSIPPTPDSGVPIIANDPKPIERFER